MLKGPFAIIFFLFRSTGSGAKKDPLPSLFFWFRSMGSGAKETLCHHDFFGLDLWVLALKRPFAIIICLVSVYWFWRFRDPLPSWCFRFRSIGSGAKEIFCHHDFFWFRSIGFGAKETLCHHYYFLFRFLGSGAKETLCHHDFLGLGLWVLALKRPFAIIICLVSVYWFWR